MEEASNEEDDMQQRARPPENHAATEAVGNDQNPHPHHQPPFPPPSCPRCDSSNTKFCYYNNYSLSQPRYFCKNCRRYWTHGGTLRNVPVGGGSRRSKRPRISPPPPPAASLSPSNALIVQRARGLHTAVGAPSLNMAGMLSGQPSRQALPPFGGAFYGGGGSFMSSLAAMQSPHAAGINHGAAAMGGGGRFGSNMGLLQGMSFQLVKAPAPPYRHSPPPTHFLPPRTFNPWAQSVINSDASSSSGAAAASSTAAGERTDSSFTANRWSEFKPGFNPSE